jgi:hypothetical protein
MEGTPASPVVAEPIVSNPLDPELRLALAVHAQPGVFALLLGSGVSRSAGIRTGYDIIKDLTGQVAAAEGIEHVDDPDGWYRGKFGEPPSFSKASLDPTSNRILTTLPLAERSRLQHTKP